MGRLSHGESPPRAPLFWKNLFQLLLQRRGIERLDNIVADTGLHGFHNMFLLRLGRNPQYRDGFQIFIGADGALLAAIASDYEFERALLT